MYLKFVFHYPNDLDIFFIISTLDTFCWKVLGAQVKPSRANLGVDPGDQTYHLLLMRWKAKAVIYLDGVNIIPYNWLVLFNMACSNC